jgi:hypothetical protein
MSLENGVVIWVRVDEGPEREEGEGPSGPVKAGRDAAVALEDRVYLAQETLERALVPVATAARSVLHAFKAMTPDEIKVEFGVELTAAVGAVLAKSGGGCHINVTLSWKPETHPQNMTQLGLPVSSAKGTPAPAPPTAP